MNTRTSTRLLAAVLAASVLALTGCTSDAADDSGTTSTATSVTTTGDTSTEPEPEPTETTSDGPAPSTTAAPSTTEVVQPPATTPVPPPRTGNINQTVAEATLATKPPVAQTEQASYGNGVTVNLTAWEAVTTKAQTPGEIAGPGFKLTFMINNGTGQAVDLGNVVVDLADSEGTPAIPIEAGSAPFKGSVAAGQSATGVYVFTVDSGYVRPAIVSVTYTVDAPVVQFRGPAQ
jgi:hypothetical protein